MPWITFAAITYLKQVLSPDMRVFEYGTGGSTLFFARRVAEVISVEHDPVWYEQLREIIENRNINNTHVQLIEPCPEASTQAQAANPDANARVTAAVLGCFPGELFDSTGLLKSVWMMRLAATATDAQGLISDLLASERVASAPGDRMGRGRKI